MQVGKWSRSRKKGHCYWKRKEAALGMRKSWWIVISCIFLKMEWKWKYPLRCSHLYKSINMSDLICHIINLGESKQKGFNSKNINKVRKKNKIREQVGKWSCSRFSRATSFIASMNGCEWFSNVCCCYKIIKEHAGLGAIHKWSHNL